MHVRSANVSQWTAIRIQNTLTIREWITLRMVSSLTAIDLTNEKNNMLLVWNESNLVKLETCCTVIVLPYGECCSLGE